jgi:hypothetical protein
MAGCPEPLLLSIDATAATPLNRARLGEHRD